MVYKNEVRRKYATHVPGREKRAFPVAFCSRQLVRETCSNAGNGATEVLSSSDPVSRREDRLPQPTPLTQSVTHIRAKPSIAELPWRGQFLWKLIYYPVSNKWGAFYSILHYLLQWLLMLWFIVHWMLCAQGWEYWECFQTKGGNTVVSTSSIFSILTLLLCLFSFYVLQFTCCIKLFFVCVLISLFVSLFACLFIYLFACIFIHICM